MDQLDLRTCFYIGNIRYSIYDCLNKLFGINRLEMKKSAKMKNAITFRNDLFEMW